MSALVPGQSVVVAEQQERIGGPAFPGRSGTVVRRNSVGPEYVYVRLHAVGRSAERVEQFHERDLIPQNAPHQARAIASRPECSCSASGYDPECKWEGHHHA